ncbi:phage tail protein [Sphingosinicella sp. YJ22]|uniref:phage tail protein n=1 Tax=Sphingosinicella sp. YJ22 TaxID=1104780 RepID=UPI001FAF0C45|nr:phage tail protein [Sphingosinicella sp. YJ22]
MATLVLTTVGTMVGGPIGGAIGAVLGQAIDQRLFAPKARHGPRLGDLSVQTSAYGSAIPKIFGTMRVAGTVIWSTEIIERRATSGGGKGRPGTVDYSYGASFAVALSGRPIAEVRRIWADGKLLRGAAGDWKAKTGFRFYPGSENQVPDPLIASAEGTGLAPAFRGIAYVMFEELELADFGNRIPSLSFEVVADPGPVTIGAVAEELSGGALAAGETPALAGFAAGGDSVRAAIEDLAGIVPLSIADDGSQLVISLASEPVQVVAAQEEAGRRKVERRAAATLPREVTVTYYDAARDYQTGLQRATAAGGAEARGEQRALPAVLDAAAAKAIAERRLECLWVGRTSATVTLGWSRAELRAGTLVELEGEGGMWPSSGRRSGR